MVIERTTDSRDAAEDIVEILSTNMDLLIEIKDAMDSAPQAAVKKSLYGHMN